ncbi:MAG TPA: PIG-L family deacetylase [Abditibacterium sp.]|jgi:LmbE family N-acetylglucosaminyl deacetylase
MKPTPNFPPENGPILAFGAHPDDIEFGCGAVIASEVRGGRGAHLVVCSRGEAASFGTPQEREIEARNAAAILGASIEWLELDGDSHLEIRVAHALKIAAIVRRVRPEIVLAPSLVENQHPDHAKLGHLVRDAARLARYGGVAELRDLAPHSIGALFFYAASLQTEPRDISPILFDVSAPGIIEIWKAAMNAHASQTNARKYVELQLTRARLHGLAAGIDYAIPLFPSDAVVVDSLSSIGRGARHF